MTGPSPARLLRILRRRLVGLPEVPERGEREAAATITRPADPPMPNGGPCPLCGKLVALPLLEGHLQLHEMRGERE